MGWGSCSSCIDYFLIWKVNTALWDGVVALAVTRASRVILIAYTGPVLWVHVPVIADTRVQLVIRLYARIRAVRVWGLSPSLGLFLESMRQALTPLTPLTPLTR